MFLIVVIEDQIVNVAIIRFSHFFLLSKPSAHYSAMIVKTQW